MKVEVSLSERSAGLRFAISNEYARLHSDGKSIIVDSVNHWSLSTDFGIAILKRQPFYGHLTLLPREEAYLTYILRVASF